AMRDAGVTPADIDYISLHGTGTRDNDLAEERAVQTLFGDDAPAASSIKGATGHSLAAAGAIEAVVAGLSIAHGLVPGNPGFSRPDPEMKLKPVAIPKKAPVATVLSNSFGFGGNNAALVIRRHGHASTSSIVSGAAPSHLTIAGRACVTGAGKTEATWQAIEAGESCAGVLDEGPLSQGLPPRAIRRLKRLPKMAMALAADLCAATSETLLPGMVIMGTAWGALSETHDFLKGVIDSNGRFPSPTDFIGSVHNAPAGQIAMMLGAKGANITVSGGDCSFEQALLTADLLTRNHPVSLMVTAADEHHPVFSPLFDASVRQAGLHADGGGALLLSRQKHPAGPSVALLHLRAGWEPEAVAALIHRLGGGKQIEERFGAVLVGLPAGCRDQAQRQLTAFLTQTRFEGPLVDYRRYLGEFASASAVAAVLAAQMVMQGAMPGGLTQGKTCHLNGKGILVLGLGEQISAVGIMPA
ncbi:MAG: 3-oxoacyl-ACP synthase, partial [Desulfatitalea sp.]|nr:beta-ketoacyl synthase chain length factor [Desulfatitalea sp.]NNK00878.1 3-oxoacyl-ACP synthase [Desulfatitalea sp.]